MTQRPLLVDIDRLTVASSGDPTKIALGVGAVHVATKPNLVWTVLGSCVSVILFVPRMKVSAICHAQLPKPGKSGEQCNEECAHPCFRNRSDANSLRYVTCCVEYMFKALDRLQVRKNGIAASVIGGASLLGTDLKRSVGNQNVELARQILESHGIAVAYDHTGGTHGRTLTYTTDTGQIKVHVVRSPK